MLNLILGAQVEGVLVDLAGLQTAHVEALVCANIAHQLLTDTLHFDQMFLLRLDSFLLKVAENFVELVLDVYMEEVLASCLFHLKRRFLLFLVFYGLAELRAVRLHAHG